MIERLRRWALPALTISLLIAAGIALDLSGALPLYRAAIHRTPSLLPSTIVMAPEEVARGVSTVSLYVPPEELEGEGIGILRYRLRHGPSWERFGWISFFENGRLVFSGGAGVRVHGGGSRRMEGPQSFRLFFRRRYGLEQAPGRHRVRRRSQSHAQAPGSAQRRTSLADAVLPVPLREPTRVRRRPRARQHHAGDPSRFASI